MKIKQASISLLLAIMMIASIIPAALAIDTGVKIKVTLLNQDPDPVQPADTTELRFKVENTGSNTLQDVVFEVLPSYPFSVIGNATQNLGTVNAQLVDSNGIIVKYQLKIDSGAPSKEYIVPIRYRQNGAWIELRDFSVSVKTSDVDVIVNSIQVTPSVVAPGEKFKMDVNLENQLSQQVKDVKVKVDFSDENIPFAPFGSTSEISIQNFASHSSQTASFYLIAKPDAKAGLYKVPVAITFEDLNGNKFNKSTITGVQVSSKAELLTLVEKSTLIQGDSSGDISVKIVNKGLTDVHFVVLSAQQSETISIVSSKDVYLGKIESDDFQTADFSVTIKKTGESAVTLPLIIQYKDATNEQFEQALPLEIRLLTKDEAQKLGLAKSGSPLPLIIAALAIGAVIWWWRGRNKKKK